MPPTPQPTTPSPFTIVVCESVPKTVSGYATRPAVRLVAADDAREVLDVDLMDDAGLGRHDAEVAERRLAPAQEHVALAVALVLEVGVQLERVRAAEVIDLHRVIDDELDRLQRIDLLGIAAERGDAVAHRGEIDDARHAGEVLQQDARGHERDFLLDGARGRPARQRPDVVGLDERRRPRGAAGSRAGSSARTAGARRRGTAGSSAGRLK